ncbi:hypothetical protein F4777DRAFT_508046 [Nemania sp. FL0916]|nr:hypothetical protein F4777DRAFT_508046 [Nemania sp. FL0916]
MAKSNSTDPLQPPVSPWSCFPCRRRKIRCDRRYPCSHCSKGDLDCGFPVSGRTPTRRHDIPSFGSKKESQADLLSRLRRLEGFVARMGSGAGENSPGGDLRETSQNFDLDTQLRDRSQRRSTDKHRQAMAELAHVTDELGTLVMHNNESMYVGNWLWGVICDEVRHIRQVVEDSSMESESLDKRVLGSCIQGVPFFWGPSTLDHESLRPLPSQVLYIWEIFVENVDPFIKILHVPTVGKIIKEAKGKFNLMTRGMEALMFAICLAAVNSLHQDEVEENFGKDKQTLLARLRLGTEQALSRAGVLNTTDISTVQAFIIYLEAVKQNDGQRATWTLAGLLMRIAVGMGLHRDGSHFSNVTPFDAEIRRRVWYHICLIDSRVGECQAPNAGITMSLFDTKKPSNLNDTDIAPDMTVLPVSSEGYTDSTFYVLRCKMWHFACRFKSTISTEPGSHEDRTADRPTLLKDIRKDMAQDLKRYLNPESDQFHCLIHTMIVLELSRFDQIIHVANNFKSPSESHKAFALAVANLQHVFHLAEQKSSAQWSWYLVSCIQWHTMSTILVHLSTSPWGPTAEMAWGLAKKAFVHLSEGLSRDPMRQPLQDLMGSVTKHRELQIQKLRANPTWAEKLARIGSMPGPVPTLHDLADGDEALDTAMIEERLAFEMNESRTLPEEFGVENSTPSHSSGGYEGMDKWIDLTPSFIETDPSDDVLQVFQNTSTNTDWVEDGDLEQHMESTPVDHWQNDSPHDQEPWDSRYGGDSGGLGWLDWDNILSTEDAL